MKLTETGIDLGTIIFSFSSKYYKKKETREISHRSKYRINIKTVVLPFISNLFLLNKHLVFYDCILSFFLQLNKLCIQNEPKCINTYRKYTPIYINIQKKTGRKYKLSPLNNTSVYARLFATPCTVACQSPLSIGFFRESLLRVWVQSLVGELKSHRLWGAAKKCFKHPLLKIF